MAYYYATIGTAAGERLAIWDDYVILNAKWTCHDASAGTNCKVYKHYDTVEPSLFYVKVDDNQSNYSTMELWEGWDADAHVGTGASVTNQSSVYYRLYAYQGVHIIVNDRRVIIGGGPYQYGNYIGQLRRVDVSRNMPILVCGSSAGTTGNPLGYYNIAGQYTFWRALFGPSGQNDYAINPVGMAGTSAYNFRHTFLGTYIFEETMVYGTGNLVLGWLDGALTYGATSLTYEGNSSGTIVWTDQGRWLSLAGGTGACWVRLA